MTRLRRVSAQDPGWRRLRSGRGFRYVDQTGTPLDDAGVSRVKGLVIPPAWQDVWICPDERGHLQAVGIDEAGRKQYLYHPVWRQKRDAAKFDRVLEMAEDLPAVRRRLKRRLKGPPTDRDTVLAAAVRMIDLGCFRIGSEAYAETNGSYGLTTLQRRHVSRDGSARMFCFVAKAGVEQQVRLADAAVNTVIDALMTGRKPSAHLLSYREGNRWRPVQPAEINQHLRDLFDAEVTAKDFRTWHATVRVAAQLASVERGSSKSKRAKQVREAVKSAAELLGNTPTVARSSYVDPRVVDLFEDGRTIEPVRGQDALDRAVVKLLDEHG